MKNKPKKLTVFVLIILVIVILAMAAFTIFFDQAVLVRKGTVFHIKCNKKVVALTFDDGPSPEWTPKILDALKDSGVKAAFFMIGEHVKMYPEVARRVAQEGHEIGNHSYDHHVLMYYKLEEVDKEIKGAQDAIKAITGQTTKYFRPPKAWLNDAEKAEIERIGYKVILWDLNSKDWVTFDDKYIVNYILRHVKPGDIILFHDSGGVFTTEGGDRHETVRAIPMLVNKLKERGYGFVTISELLNMKCDGKN